MAALQDYAQLAVIMDGNVLEQISSIHLSWNSGNQRVDLLNTGLSGFTPGSGDVTIEVGFMTPIGGLEDDFTGKLTNRDYVTMQVPIGGKDYIGKGKIDKCDISQSTNASVEGTFTWIGQIHPLQ
jgi:hypothetical protein